MINDIVKKIDGRMDKVIERFESDLSKIRTGRANPNMLNHLMVDYYGTPTPIAQTASISAADPKQLVIKPYDRGISKSIVAAINASDLGLQGMDQGDIIRVNIPQLTEDRRKGLVKDMWKAVEQFKVGIRNERHEGNEEMKKGDFSEDERKHGENEIQKLTDKYIKMIDEIGKKKEKDLMTV